MRTFWRRALALATVRPRAPEQLRHRAASLLLSRCPIVFVGAQGGWCSATTVLSFYSKWLPAETDVALSPAPAQRPATSPQLVNARRRLTS